jgi:hypothetical protein
MWYEAFHSDEMLQYSVLAQSEFQFSCSGLACCKIFKKELIPADAILFQVILEELFKVSTFL